MLRIAVCNNNLKEIDIINLMLEKYFTFKKKVFKADFFHCGKNLLNCGTKFDLIILDLDIKDISGISAAKKIRENDLNVPIVFTAEKYTDWQNTFRVHAFDFVQKPLDYDDIFMVLNDFYKYTQANKKKVVNLNTDKGSCIYNTSDIFYFFADSKRKIILQTTSGQQIIKENLCEIFDKLDKKQFYMSHRSCIINFDYVDYVSNYNIIMKNKDCVPLAQKKKKEFMQKMHDFCICV
ncbi:MAG: LytR/AlgR family response regulator transcription factor [Hominimerdicola sp.]